jgi:hypothetical protein
VVLDFNAFLKGKVGRQLRMFLHLKNTNCMNEGINTVSHMTLCILLHSSGETGHKKAEKLLAVEQKQC